MSRLEQAEQLTSLMEAIKSYQRYQADSVKRYNRYKSIGLDSSYNLHNVEIQGMVIARLELRYRKLIIKMYKAL